MPIYLGTVEEYEYKNHSIKIQQKHYSNDKHLTFKADVDGEHRFTVDDYAHRHEGIIGLTNLNILRRLLSSDYKKKRVKDLKQETENRLDERIAFKKRAEEMSL